MPVGIWASTGWDKILYLAYLQAIPSEFYEAARLDGASAFGIHWSIVLSLIRPILVTGGVSQAMWVWNDFITPNVFINSPDKQTLVLHVYPLVGRFSTDRPKFMTLSVIVHAQLMVFFVFAQRYIASGLVSGSAKG